MEAGDPSVSVDPSAASITKMFAGPSRSLENAIFVPSGLKTGSSSRLSFSVSRTTLVGSSKSMT
jgi:hypothetical protein